MLVLILLIPAVAAIAKVARGRGLSPWLAGSSALVGWILLELATEAVFQPAGESALGASASGPGARMALEIAALCAPWTWLGIVFLLVRFALGYGHARSRGRWNCPECRWLNEAAFIQCESCGREYRDEQAT